MRIRKAVMFGIVFLHVLCLHASSFLFADRGQGFIERPEAAIEDEDLETLQSKAEAGDADAQNALGAINLEEKAYAKAWDWFEKAAAAGHPLAHHNLGLMQLYGWGVQRNYEGARQAFKSSAESGIAAAQYNLALLYFEGLGVPADSEVAVYWLRKAAEQGFAPAQHNLGNALLTGRGIAKDPESAAAWYEKAAMQENPFAQSALGIMLLSGKEVAQDLKSAAEFLRKAADQDIPEAQFHYGMMHLMGHGVRADSQTASYWMNKAAAQGHIGAQANLGKMHLAGRGVPQDQEKAVSWLRRAAEGGHVDAQFSMGVLYKDGAGVEQDIAKAFDWLERAAKQGHLEAQFHVGTGYAMGISGAPDYKTAYKWLAMARDRGHPEAQRIIAMVSGKLAVHEIEEIESSLPATIEPGRSKPDLGSEGALEEIKQLAAEVVSDNIRKKGDLPSVEKIINDYDLARKSDELMARITSEADFHDFRRDRIVNPGSMEEEIGLMITYANMKADIEPDVRAWLRFFEQLGKGMPWEESFNAYNELKKQRPLDLQPKLIMLLKAQMADFNRLSPNAWEEWTGILDEAISLSNDEAQQGHLLVLAAIGTRKLKDREAATAIKTVWNIVRETDHNSFSQNGVYSELSAASRILVAMLAEDYTGAAEIARSSSLRSIGPLLFVFAGNPDVAMTRIAELRVDETLKEEEKDLLRAIEPLVLLSADKLPAAKMTLHEARRRSTLTDENRRLLDVIARIFEHF